LTSIVLVNAQTIEDAYRYSQPNGVITPRAGGLGIAYQGIADDYAALFHNPAGLSLITKSELNFGFGFLNHNQTTDFNKNSTDFSISDGFISNVGVVAPTSHRKRKAALAIGYFYEGNYNGSHEFSAYNVASSMIGHQAKYGAAPNSGAINWAYELYLADKKGDDSGYTTDYNDNMMQEGFVDMNGGMNNISGGLGFDLNDNFALGFSIIGKIGSFEYYREYSEYDSKGLHNTPVEGYELDRFTYSEFYNSSITGITGKVGMQARLSNNFRLGVAVELPTWYNFDDDFGKTYAAQYTDGRSIAFSPYSEYAYDTLMTSYSLVTPFVYSLGASYNIFGLTVSGAVEYSDASQIEYTDAAPELSSVNRAIAKELTSQLKYGLGVEWQVPNTPVQLRASYQNLTSPYQNDIEDENTNFTTIAGGASLFLGKSVRMDAVVSWSSMEEYRSLYGYSDESHYSYYKYTSNPLNIALGIAYRF
jgi:hypothetical protein